METLGNKVTVTYYIFGQEIKGDYDSMDEAFKAIRSHYSLTNGQADYEIKAR